jgi:hypothetical protein
MDIRIRHLAISLAFALVAVGGCSSSSPAVDAAGGTGGGSDGPATDAVVLPAGPVAGPPDDHCGAKVQMVDPAVCMAGPPDASASDGGEDEEEIRYNAEADDDDCKYHMSFTTTAVGLNKDVFFTVKATKKSDGTAAPWGAQDDIEAFTEDMTHPAPNITGKPVQSPVGTMKFGPVRFDRAGRWVVRFHIQHACTDNDEASPHSHAAFFINVP